MQRGAKRPTRIFGKKFRTLRFCFFLLSACAEITGKECSTVNEFVVEAKEVEKKSTDEQ